MKISRIGYILWVAIACTISLSMVNGPSSSGAPASHTGAPDEQTCATAGCHDDNPVNAGKALVGIDIGSVTRYTPGKNYTLKVRIADSAIRRFGFQIVALSSDNKNLGRLKV